MANDISLAVGDGARRMTYAELADVRGISAASAERLVRRRRWPRQVGNDGVVRVLVPLTEARKLSRRAASDVRTDKADIPPGKSAAVRMSSQMSAPDVTPDVRTLETAVTALSDALAAERAVSAAERARAERAELAIEHLRDRIDALLALWIERRAWWRRWFR